MSLLASYIEHAINVFPSLLRGAVITIEVTTFAIFFGLILGTIAAFGKLSRRSVFRIPSSIYVDFIRGTPLFVQILLFYYGIPGLIIGITGEPFRIDPILAGIAVCSINSGAYNAEIVRAGIKSVDRGQMEAARSLGMTEGQAMKEVIMPQAVRLIIPPLGNEFIALLKDSSLLAVISVHELSKNGMLYVSKTFAAFPTYISVAFVYLALTMGISRVLNHIERRLGVSDRSE
ncbi:amino acid ABC transporter permease [Methanosarcina mazei]|uniref:Nickel transporter n=3 Tax=Methanosarcina mazei TaxID=2209 RepID=A0A0F8M0K5_METMZ|nr:amino acid ABC transporter permease [Methanosarcina mazei]AKB41681.1 Glutamate transport membrane-spanning protein [Methanosarcina mazei WWM610]AKB62593.1 Glutamate transport membrane-spanning protein [Methanosarcina mazei SarPi]KKH18374.1 nickel transporter [Methanosarcina mazei]KKH19461.1 nickel transporter [Methanosarcina mazei]KKH22045.1 nickel transporter [Methanosarcina mazei]